MAESLAALGVACNIVQFVELGFSISKSILETYRSTNVDGLANRYAELDGMIDRLEKQRKLLEKDASVKTDTDIMDILQRSMDVAKLLRSEINGLRTNPNTNWRRLEKVSKGFRAYWKKDEIESLYSRIKEIKEETFQQLMSLLFQQRSSLHDSVTSFQTAVGSWNSATELKLDNMAQSLGKLVASNSNNATGSNIQAFAKELSTFTEEAKNYTKTQTILTGLHFPEIKKRQNAILPAHANTYEWIFDTSRAMSFSSWVKDPSISVFWVTGKAGSGKSTLMKLILNHQQTRPLAKVWAGPKPLIIASHFFWNSGTQLQMSQEGLMRTLLFQIFVQCRDIIPKVCAERCSDPFRSLESWGVEELSEVFDRIRAARHLPARILLLIDGLDEYRGDVENLTSFLKATASSEDIKVCCASRPSHQIKEGLREPSWTIHMHQLTENDMKVYITAKLGQNIRFQELRKRSHSESEKLIQAISKKADGVFLWVSLVVKSLNDGLGQFDDFEDLFKRLEALPQGLPEFFQNMLESISEQEADQAFLVFAVLLSSKTPLPLDAFLNLSHKLGQKRKSISKRSISQERDRILVQCRDLVETWEITNGRGSCNIRLGFLHRTLFDFLPATPAIKTFMARLSQDPHHLLASMYYAQSHDEDPSYQHKITLITERNDYILRMCHLVQELESVNDLPRVPFWDLFTKLRYYIEPRKTPPSCPCLTSELDLEQFSRVVAHAQARVMLRLGEPQFGELTDLHLGILSGILQGDVFVGVSDHAAVTFDDFIDLRLLKNVLSLYNTQFVRPQKRIYLVWKRFILELANPRPRKATPRNALDACKIFIQFGAPRWMLFPIGVISQDLQVSRDLRGTVDVVSLLKNNIMFKEAELNVLGELFCLQEKSKSPKEPPHETPAPGFIWSWWSALQGNSLTGTGGTK